MEGPLELPMWQPPAPTLKSTCERFGIKVEEFTCYDCPAAVVGCEFAWDPYNTDGDCLADK